MKLGNSITAGLLLMGMTTPAVAAETRPQRIVSTNYCTDQILLRLVEPERILSLTYISWDLGNTAPEVFPALDHIKMNHGLAEEVLTMRPDLVMGGTFSARFTNGLLGRLGYKVILFDAETSFEEWYENIRIMGHAVGEPERAEKMVAEFKTGLAALTSQIPPGEMPIYADLTINNWMPGNDTLYTQVVNAGGFRTAGQSLGFSGYQGIPLEKLIQIDIDLISSKSKYENPPSMATQNLRHPLLRRMVEKAYASINIPPRYVTCTTPETLKMVALLIQARKDVDTAKAARKAAGAAATR